MVWSNTVQMYLSLLRHVHFSIVAEGLCMEYRS